jgi:hypothetical protein
MIPAFIRVVPAEVKRYGANAAIVLAHIRYRCQSDGPGRIEVDGAHWWRVSRSQIGDEVGLSLSAVRHALRTLRGVIAAKHFRPLDDQSRAYRVITEETGFNSSELPEVVRDTWAELPEVVRDAVKCPTEQGTASDTTSALFIENLEKGGEARAQAGKRTAQPDSTPAKATPPSQKHSEEQKPAPDGASPEDNKPKHRPELSSAIHTFAKTHDIEQAGDPPAHRDDSRREERDRHRERLEGIKDCHRCDDDGYLDDDTQCWHRKDKLE